MRIWESLHESADRSTLTAAAKDLIKTLVPNHARLVIINNSRVKLVHRSGDVLNLLEDEPGQLLVLPVGQWLAAARQDAETQ